MAAELSHRQGWLDRDALERTRALVEAARLPTDPPPGLAPERFRELMAVDKKVQSGRLRLVLLKGIGKSLVTGEFDPAKLEGTLMQAASATS